MSELSLEDLKDLPPELLEQLNLKSPEFKLLHIQSILSDTPMSIDAILIQYFKNTKEVMQRTKMMSLLYRLEQKNAIEKVSGKKGFYRAKRKVENGESE